MSNILDETLITIDDEQVHNIANIFKRINIVPDSFTDPQYYPPENEDKELVLAYFFAMVAIDHRTSILVEYRTKMGDLEYKGADLLWRLGKEMYDRDPTFFLPRNLANLDINAVRRWLCINNIELWDIGVRTLLLRDLGKKVETFYNSKFTEIINRSGGKIYGDNGLVNLLKIFRAYEDPVEKKAFLLIKFLERRKLVEVKDQENLHVPVDNHLTRIAFRLGIVKLNEKLMEIITRQIETSRELDIEIRFKVREAWKKVSEISNKKPTILDDYLWNHGRKICTPENPKCEKCELKSTCKAYRTKIYVKEHKHTLTWYY